MNQKNKNLVKILKMRKDLQKENKQLINKMRKDLRKENATNYSFQWIYKLALSAS